MVEVVRQRPVSNPHPYLVEVYVARDESEVCLMLNHTADPPAVLNRVYFKGRRLKPRFFLPANAPHSPRCVSLLLTYILRGDSIRTATGFLFR